MIERINELIGKLDLTPSKFADEIGVPRSTISHLVSGRNKPSLDFIMKIVERFPETDINWIIFGKGNAINPNKNVDISEQIRNNSSQKHEISTKSQPPDLFSFAEEIDKKPEIIAKDEESAVYHRTPRKLLSDDEESIKKQILENQSDIDKVIILYKDKTFVEYKSK